MPDFFIPKNENDLKENIHILNFALETPPEINELVVFISQISQNTRAYIVGGSVRDAIISAKNGIEIEIKDFDIEVYGTEVEDLISALKEKYQSVIEVGKSFGVLKVKIPGIDEPVDIALPRVDIKFSEDAVSKRGRGIIAQSDPHLDLVKAVKRRDITLNSILYDPITRQIIDPFNGWDDLMNRVIRVTDPDTFIEDPLRILRVAQFASRFDFSIDKETLELCKKLIQQEGMKDISIDRIREELDKLLIKGYKPSIGIKFLKDIGYLDTIIPELSVLETIPQEPDYHPEGDVFTHTMQVIDAMAEIIRREKRSVDLDNDTKRALVLGALFHDLGKATKTVIDENGRIRSHGHEDAGVPIAKEIIRRIYKSENQNSDIPLENLILILVSEHMVPLLLHKESKEGKDMSKALRRFTHKCIQNNTNINHITWIVEADKRGRNPNDKTKPLSLESKPDLIEALRWFHESTKEVELEISSSNSKIFEVPKFLEELNSRGFKLKGGPWIKIILKCVELDLIDQEISKEDCLKRAFFYFDLFFSGKSVSEFINNRNFWVELLKSKDPREHLKELTN
jgi:tRNA nucleotidyltransferase (CCA-adding enzyme)